MATPFQWWKRATVTSREERRARVHARRRGEEAMRIERLRARADAAARCRRGAGTVEDFELVLDDLIAQQLDEFVPMAVIGRARRELGLGIGPRRVEEKWSLFAADVLSFHPAERLDHETVRTLAELDRVVVSPTTEPVERCGAIFARALIGPGQGEERRAWCWYDAGAQHRAEQDPCHLWMRRNAGLVDCWPQLERFLDEAGFHEKLAQRAGIRPPSVDPEAWIRVDSLGVPTEEQTPAREEQEGRVMAELSYVVYADLLRIFVRSEAFERDDHRDGAATSEAGISVDRQQAP